jgi:hypothetical protein
MCAQNYAIVLRSFGHDHTTMHRHARYYATLLLSFGHILYLNKIFQLNHSEIMKHLHPKKFEVHVIVIGSIRRGYRNHMLNCLLLPVDRSVFCENHNWDLEP